MTKHPDQRERKEEFILSYGSRGVMSSDSTLVNIYIVNIACEIRVGARERNTMGANRKSQITLVCRCYDSILLPEVSEI